MNDFRYALRQLLRHFGFSLAAIVTLGIGIGLVATQYSLVDGMLLRPLPFAHADRIRHVAASLGNEYREWSGIPLDTFAAMHEQQTAFERLAGTRSETYNLAAPGELPQRLWGAAVTPEFFDILAVPPLLGRHLQAADSAPGAPPRAVIAHKLYVETFGSDPSVIGRSVRLNGEQVTIVGVMPEGFMFPGTESVWVRLRLPPPGAPVDPLATVEAMGLLADGQTDASAAAQLAAVGERYTVTASDARVRPQRSGVCGMYLQGRWYRLEIQPGLVPASDPVRRLDVSVLSEQLLGPVLGITDLRRDTRIEFVGGMRGLAELERRVDSGEMALAFAMYPTQMADLMAVADAGQVMPPKSTWFEPKLADGLVSHLLD